MSHYSGPGAVLSTFPAFHELVSTNEETGPRTPVEGHQVTEHLQGSCGAFPRANWSPQAVAAAPGRASLPPGLRTCKSSLASQ